MNEILYKVDNSPMIINKDSFITLLRNWYNNRLHSLIRQFLLIPNRISEFRDLRL
jgi:hypothetical protein